MSKKHIASHNIKYYDSRMHNPNYSTFMRMIENTIPNT